MFESHDRYARQTRTHKRNKNCETLSKIGKINGNQRV